MIKAHFGTIPAAVSPRPRPIYRRARSSGHALHRRHRPRSHGDDGQASTHDGGARPDDHRRLSAADDRAHVFSGLLSDAAGRDRAEAGRAVPRRARPTAASSCNPTEVDDAERAGAGRRRREGAGGALHRGRSRGAFGFTQTELDRYRLADHAQSSSSSPRRMTSTRRIRSPTSSSATSCSRSRSPASPTSTRSCSASCRRSPSPTSTPRAQLGARSQPRRRRQRAEEGGRRRADRGGAGGGDQELPAATR